MHAWCHGAPGIGLARHEMLSCELPEQLHSPLQADLTKALRATWHAMVGPEGYLGVGNHSICHGDLGNAELLAAVSPSPRTDQTQAPAPHDHAHPLVEPPVLPEQLISAIVADARQRGWQCGVPTGSEVIGLMPGIAGIDYQLLHLARPSRVPSILRMQPPTPKTPSHPTPTKPT
jgi:lantibiotic modifying enzyme